LKSFPADFVYWERLKKENSFCMKKILLFSLFLIIMLNTNGKRPLILVITGGHGYDSTAFFSMFNALDGIRYDHLVQPKANQAIANGKVKKYDVLVFYDMWQSVSESEKQGYYRLLESGKSMLFLHHALVSYQEWPEFEKIRGGKYLEKAPNEVKPASELSTYRHDVWVEVKIVNPEHPVTSSFRDFSLFDEVYGNYRIEKGVIPLLATNHPESTSLIGWENRYANSAIIYLQPGHDSHSFNNENYRKLLTQAIVYLSEKSGKSR
jgi:uncharacterized protein